MLATAFVMEGKYASSIPSFGVERRGAPVAAFLRFDEKPIRDTHQIYEPDCVVILDPSSAKSEAPLLGLKGDGIVIINSSGPPEAHYSQREEIKLVAWVDATGIALEKIGRAISNTCMLGAVARATAWVRLDSVLSGLEQYFSGEALKRNISAAESGYERLNLVPLRRG
jgi:2-oxoacid:acceptor oxidoreductase gamma subunit (pyruvate/2-ketoisovalerate family)